MMLKTFFALFMAHESYIMMMLILNDSWGPNKWGHLTKFINILHLNKASLTVLKLLWLLEVEML